MIYRQPELARRVNVDATVALPRVARSCTDPPRFIQASHSDKDWFVTDWMDSARSQQALSFQHHRWPDMLAEMRALAGWRRYPMRLVAPIARRVLKCRAAYRNAPGRYADPWGAIRADMGEPRSDINECAPASRVRLSRRLAATAGLPETGTARRQQGLIRRTDRSRL